VKLRPPRPPSPIRSTALPWRHHETLPPENKERRQKARDYVAEAPAAEPSDFALIDIIVEDVKLSKTKARLAIQNGLVSVNDVVVRDPDLRVTGTDVVRFFPSSKIHVTP
jgi:RNA-binding protein YlmH